MHSVNAKHLSRLILMFCLAIVFQEQAQAVSLLDNGDFETGIYAPWQSIQDKTSVVETLQNTQCYAGYDVRGLAIHGRYVAALDATRRSDSSLTSAELTAGNGFAFIALTAYSSPITKVSTGLRVDILEVDSTRVLASQVFYPHTTPLKHTCGDSAEQHSQALTQFSSHYYSTEAYSGKLIRIRFSHDSNKQADAVFSLVDQVVLFTPFEQAVFESRPHAQAGMRLNDAGQAMLSSAGSFDPDQYPRPLRYSWYINDLKFNGPSPCLSGLKPGNHSATLYANDGHHAVSDQLRVYIPPSGAKSGLQVDKCDPVQDRSLASNTEKPEQAGDPLQDVENALLSWANAWSNRNVELYLDAYTTDYAPSGKTSKEWATGRRRNFENRRYIKVALSNTRIQADGQHYRASFTQNYESDTYKDEIKKELLFVYQDGHWRISTEKSP